MDRLINAVKAHAAAQVASLGQPRMATVTSYNPNDGTAKVQIQPEGVLTGWLPVLSDLVGSGWGIHANLPPGTQVCVVAQEGDATHGVIVGRVYSDAMRPPALNGSDVVIQSSADAFIQMLTNGGIVIQDPSGAEINFQNNGAIAITATIDVTGSLAVNGNVSIDGTLAVTGQILLNGTSVLAS